MRKKKKSNPELKERVDITLQNDIIAELNRTGVLSQEFKSKIINYINAIQHEAYDAGKNPKAYVGSDNSSGWERAEE